MDNVTHSLLAVALAKTPLARRTPLAGAALLLGANLPDADGVAYFWGGKAAYLHHHRGVSHSIPGIAVESLVLWAILRWIAGWWELDNRASRGCPKWGLYMAGLTGLASHAALDALNSYGLRPWLPFSDARVFGDLCFIVDPWLWLLFGAAAAAGSTSRAGTALWIVTAAAATAVVYTAPQSPLHLKLGWPLGLAAVAWARRWPAGRTAFVVALLTAAYLTALAELGRSAERQAFEASSASLRDGERVESVSRSPNAATPWRWTVFVETDRAILQRWVSVAGNAPDVSVRIPKGMDSLEARAATLTREGRVWREFARHPFAAVLTVEGRSVLYLMDARHQSSPGPGWSALEVEVGN